MKVIDLYKFIKENDIEFRYEINNETQNKEIDVLIWIPFYHLEDFQQLLGDSIFDESPITCYMTNSSICYWMTDIVSYYGIELEEIFGKQPIN